MKPYVTNKANIGDIIRSEKFAFGYYDHERDTKQYIIPKKDMITIDGYTKSYPLGFSDPCYRGQGYKNLTVELGAYDSSRGKANFVVEETSMSGGGTGHGPHDVYPNGWHILARRLGPNNNYNPCGELIQFYQSGCFNCMVPEVEVVGKMQRVFVPVI